MTVGDAICSKFLSRESSLVGTTFCGGKGSVPIQIRDLPGDSAFSPENPVAFICGQPRIPGDCQQFGHVAGFCQTDRLVGLQDES